MVTLKKQIVVKMVNLEKYSKGTFSAYPNMFPLGKFKLYFCLHVTFAGVTILEKNPDQK